MIVAALVLAAGAVGSLGGFFELLAGTAENNFKILGWIFEGLAYKVYIGVFDFQGFQPFAGLEHRAAERRYAFW